MNTQVQATNMASGILEYPLSFNSNGQMEGGQFFIYQVQGGAFVLLETD